MLCKQNNVRQSENKKRFSDQVKCEINKVDGANMMKTGIQELTRNDLNNKKLKNNNITLLNLLSNMSVSKLVERDVIAKIVG